MQVSCPVSAATEGRSVTATSVERHLPEVRLIEESDAVISAEMSAFRIGRHLYVGGAAEGDTNGELPAVAAGDHMLGSFALLRRRPTERLESGIFVGGAGNANYYHFVTEIASKLEYLPDDMDCELLVAEASAAVPQFLEVLMLVRPQARLRILQTGCDYRVKQLTWLTDASHTPYNLRPGVWPRCDDTYLDHHSLMQLRSRALSQIASVKLPSLPSRVFLSRPVERRGYNKVAVQELLTEHGFIPIATEQLSLLEQAAIFNNADVVVGPSGAAWTNLLFGKSGGIALYWIPEQLKCFSAWTALGSLVGTDVRYVTYETPALSTSGAYAGQYELPISLLERALGVLVTS